MLMFTLVQPLLHDVHTPSCPHCSSLRAYISYIYYTIHLMHHISHISHTSHTSHISYSLSFSSQTASAASASHHTLGCCPVAPLSAARGGGSPQYRSFSSRPPRAGGTQSRPSAPSLLLSLLSSLPGRPAHRQGEMMRTTKACHRKSYLHSQGGLVMWGGLNLALLCPPSSRTTLSLPLFLPPLLSRVSPPTVPPSPPTPSLGISLALPLQFPPIKHVLVSHRTRPMLPPLLTIRRSLPDGEGCKSTLTCSCPPIQATCPPSMRMHIRYCACHTFQR